jgi:hypothetical protein
MSSFLIAPNRGFTAIGDAAWADAKSICCEHQLQVHWCLLVCHFRRDTNWASAAR